jgi:hypothetical protein
MRYPHPRPPVRSPHGAYMLLFAFLCAIALAVLSVQ